MGRTTVKIGVVRGHARGALARDLVFRAQAPIEVGEPIDKRVDNLGQGAGEDYVEDEDGVRVEGEG